MKKTMRRDWMQNRLAKGLTGLALICLLATPVVAAVKYAQHPESEIVKLTPDTLSA
jgi:hypothetical protein